MKLTNREQRKLIGMIQSSMETLVPIIQRLDSELEAYAVGDLINTLQELLCKINYAKIEEEDTNEKIKELFF